MLRRVPGSSDAADAALTTSVPAVVATGNYAVAVSDETVNALTAPDHGQTTKIRLDAVLPETIADGDVRQAVIDLKGHQGQ